MPEIFYLYAFVFLANKLYWLIKELFFHKKEDIIEVDLSNINVADTIGKVLTFNTLIVLFNVIWITVGIFKSDLPAFFCLLAFIDIIGVSTMFKKMEPHAEKKYYVITLIVKISVAAFVIYTHFFKV